MIPTDLFLADPALSEPRHSRTNGGVTVTRTAGTLACAHALDPVVAALDTRRGLVLSCGVEAPGRYRRGALGFVDPPLALTARGRTVRVDALNGRGAVLLPAVAAALRDTAAVAAVEAAPSRLSVLVRRSAEPFAEEERSRQPSVFAVLRAVGDLFADPGEPLLGLYGAFGYDLAFQFEPVDRKSVV